MDPLADPVAAVPLEELLAHREWVSSVARSLVMDHARAEDLEQEAWLAAIERAPQDARSPKGWLATVLRRAASKSRRSDSRRGARERAASRPEATPSTLDVVVQAETHSRVVRAVLDLDEPYRTTVLLRFFEDLPPREVARRMGAPVETVRARSRRALEQLAERFDGDRGGRKAWLAALLPIALTSTSAEGATALSWTGGILATAKAKTLIAAGVLSLLFLVAFVWKPFEVSSSETGGGGPSPACSRWPGPRRRTRTARCSRRMPTAGSTSRRFRRGRPG